MSLLLSALVAVTVGQSGAYVRSTTDVSNGQKHCLWWADPDITYVQSAFGHAPTRGDTEFTAITRSFQNWESKAGTCSGLNFTEGPRVNSKEVGYNDRGSNTNLMLFRPQDCHDVVSVTDSCWSAGTCGNKYDCWQENKDGVIALTLTTYDVATGRIYDGDIELNGAHFYFTTSDGPKCPTGLESQDCIDTDVENTMTHEIGHFIGLEHTLAAGSTMNPNAGSGEISKRTVDDGSASFLCDVYPLGKATRDCNDEGELVPVSCSAYADSAVVPDDCTPTGFTDDDGDGGCAAAAGALAGWAALGLWPMLRRRSRA